VTFIQYITINMLFGTVVGCVAVCEVLCTKVLTEVLQCQNVILYYVIVIKSSLVSIDSARFLASVHSVPLRL
jgi:hypothetical protein